MIIWSGRGIFVVLFALLAVFAAAAVVDLTHIRPPYLGIVYSVAELLAGVAIWYFARRIESRPGRVLIDNATGREFTLRRSAGTLFFVPTRYWAFIVPGLSLLVFAAVSLRSPA